MPEDDAQLVAASCADPERFAELFDRHYDRIAGFLRRRLPGSLADDLASETFLRAFEGRARYLASRSDAAPWLYGIATNLLREHRRKEVRGWRAYAAHAAALPVADEAPDLEGRLDADAAAPALARALAGLAPRDRDALLLLAWGDLGYGEIADALEVPVGTVRSRINRARRQLRQALSGHDLAAAPPALTTPVPATAQESE